LAAPVQAGHGRSKELSMKIASKTAKIIPLSSAVLGFALLFSAGSVPVLAADQAPPPPVSTGVTEDVASPSSATQVALPTPAASTAAGRSKNISAMEDKVQDSVKNVVKQLSTIDNVNLDDLNTARQAVVKLELLIDIEKHLAELDKIRAEHGGEKSVMAALPASALTAPPSMTTSRNRSASTFEAPSPVSHAEVTRVAGTDGHYTALVQGKFVQVGDSMPDGTTVVAISPKDVSTKSKDGTIHRLKVKGVDEIYGHSSL
jgi:hypothetical protein